MSAKFSTILFALAIAAVAGGCGRGHKDGASGADSAVAAIEADDSVPSVVKRLVRAVADDDPDSFAGIVSYPLQRPYPLPDIENAEQMRAHYREMVDDSLKRIIAGATPEKWSEIGWRGWTLDDGSYVWVDDSLYDLPYISARERVLIDSLTKAEIGSLAPSLREGWKPVLCLVDDGSGKIYRIDTRTGDENEEGHHCRVAVYKDKKTLGGLPATLAEGVMESEGTIGNVVYRFPATGGDMLIEPEAPDTGTPVLIEAGDSSVALRRAYWHELIKQAASSSSTPPSPAK